MRRPSRHASSPIIMQDEWGAHRWQAGRKKLFLKIKDGWEFLAGEILSGPGRPLADRFPEGWRRALGYSWAGPFEAGPFEAGTPENRDGISELEGRGNGCLLPIRPGQEASD